MIQRITLALVLTLALAAPAGASCANTVPAGAYVTPNCTYIVEQWDPGVWLDNLGQLWSKVVGSSKAIIVGLIGKL